METTNEPLPSSESSSSATDDSAAGANNPQPELLEKIQRASDVAFEQHSAATKRKPGQRGPDKFKRKPKLPVAKVDDGTDASLLETGPAFTDSNSWQGVPEQFDDKAAEAAVDVVISALDYLGAFVVRVVGGREVNDDAVIEQAVANCKATEEAKKNLRVGGVSCAKKYAVNLQYLPEFTLGVGVVMWGNGIMSQVRSLKADGKKLRMTNAQAQ